jgi:DNA-binding transcriptional LysR family regulator
MPHASFPDLSTRQLVAVLAVAEYGSFMAAAALLKTSQPTLTRTIRRVEDVLGVILFERTTRKVRITSAGKEFIAVAERMLNDLRITARSMRELADQLRGQVILSCIMSVANGVLPRIIAEYRTSRPAIEIHVHEGVHGSVLEDVRSGVADFGITYVDELPDAVAKMSLGQEVFNVALPLGHPLSRKQRVRLTDLANEVLVSLPHESVTRRIIDGTASAAGLTLHHVVTVTQFATMMSFVRAGVGTAIVPAGAIGGISREGISVRPIVTPRMVRRLGIIRLRERELSPAAAGMLDLIHTSWRQAAD